jgi:hypothetical protein
MRQFDAAPPVPLDYPRLAALTHGELELAQAAGYVAEKVDPQKPVRRAGLDNLGEPPPEDDLRDWRTRMYVIWFCYVYENFLAIAKPLYAIEELITEFRPEVLDTPDVRLATAYAGAGARDPISIAVRKTQLQVLEPHYIKAIALLDEWPNLQLTYIADLQSALAAAQMRRERTAQGGKREEFVAADEALLAAERALAAAQDEPHAVPIEFPVQWNTGAPVPYLLKNDYRTFLVFFLPDVDQWSWPERLAIVEFKHCISTKMGTPNDEVFGGHPLSGKGLRGYTPLRVKNSLWIKELEAINSIHSCYSPESWRNLNHYIFGFHDSTFECVAESFAVEARTAPVPEVLAEICGKLVQ